MTNSGAPLGLAFATAPEFEDILRAAAEHFAILPALVRKDYWVTRVLRAIATNPAGYDRVLFKGGTSLSKGWQLVDRFSEDIDLLLTGSDYSAMPGKGARERHLKAIRPRIESVTPLRLADLTSLAPEDTAFTTCGTTSTSTCASRYPASAPHGVASPRIGSSSKLVTAAEPTRTRRARSGR